MLPDGTYTTDQPLETDSVAFTPTADVSIVVAGTADAYTITGTHTDLNADNYSYAYDSDTGAYTELPAE